MFFCMDDMRAIRSLINTLQIPSLENRVSFCTTFPTIQLTNRLQEIILDMFFDLLNIKAPAWYQTFIDGRRLTSTIHNFLHPTVFSRQNSVQKVSRHL